MSLPLKIGIGLATLGTVGGVGYGVFAYSQDKGTEISKLIEEEFKYVLLDTKDSNKGDKQWETNWESYKKANQNNDKDFFELEGWTKGTKEDLKDKLRKKCEVLSKSKIKSTKEELYTRVATYCGRYVTVLDEAKKKELKILDTKENTSATAWSKKETGKADIENDIKALGMEYPNINAEGIKAGCAKAVTNSKELPNYESLFKSYEKVCTNPKGST